MPINIELLKQFCLLANFQLNARFERAKKCVKLADVKTKKRNVRNVENLLINVNVNKIKMEETYIPKNNFYNKKKSKKKAKKKK